MSTLKLFVLGPPRIELDGAPVSTDRRKAIALLVYLAVTGDRHSRESLATLFWPDYDRTRAYAYLRRTLWELNQALGEGWIEADRDVVSLRQEGVWLDMAAFRDCLNKEPAKELRPEQAACLEEAAALYRADFMAGFGLPDSAAFDDWMLYQSESLRRDLAGALERLTLSYGSAGIRPAPRGLSPGESLLDKAVEYARRWVALDPLNEAAHRELMRLYARMGERSAALRQYDLCRQVLERELGVEPQPETTHLAEQIRAGTLETGLPANDEALGERGAGERGAEERRPQEGIQHAPVGPLSNLPVQLTPFLGRKQELEEIDRLLEAPNCRLLTLLGAGGIGKTRLAVQAATELIPQFPDGVYFVGLASVVAAEHIIPAIGQALHFTFHEDAGEPRQQLLEYVRDRKLLLILDNYEHLLDDESVKLPLDLVSAAPRLKILVTSRASLNVRGEQLYLVGGLAVPEANSHFIAPEVLETYSAVQLFLESARRVRPEFELDAENGGAVTQICQLVQGMPLGIELAAAWIDLLTPEEILAEVQRSLDFLETEMRDVPARQRSIRAVFNASRKLLNPDEQTAFCKLSVFQGGFTRQAAEEITGATLRSLTSLANKSLVQRVSQGRYEVHALLRQYAAELLSADAETWHAVQDRHSAYYMRFLATRGEEMKGRDQQAAFNAIDADLDNVRAAFRWAVEADRFDRLDMALSGLYSYFSGRSLSKEQDVLLDRAIHALDARWPELDRKQKLLLAKLLAFRASSYFEFVSSRSPQYFQRALDIVHELHGERELGFVYTYLATGYGWKVDAIEGVRLLRESLERMREMGTPWEQAYTLRMLASQLINIREVDQCRVYLDEALALSESIGDRQGLADGLGMMAELLTRERDYEQALRIQQQVHDLHEASGDRYSQGMILEMMGRNRMSAGDYEAAIRYFRESQEIFAQLGDREALPGMLSWESIAAVRLGDYALARQAREQSLKLSLPNNDQNGIVWSYYELGELNRIEGNYAAAEKMYQEALHEFQESQFNNLNSFYQRSRGDIAMAEGKFAEAAERYREGISIAWEDYHFWNVAYLWAGLGRAQTVLGELDAARQSFRRALIYAHDEGDRGLVLVGLAGLVEWLLAGGQAEQAAELSGFVLADRATWQETRDQVAAVFAEIAAELPAEKLAAAQERGKESKLEAILERFTASGQG